MISERKIIEGCLEGKRKAYNALFKKYAALMMAVCMRYCKNREEAEDILQEGFIKVYKNIAGYRMQGSFEGWIRRIIVNTAINNYHNNLKRLQKEELNENKLAEELAGDNDHEETLNNEISKKLLMEMIQSLPDGYRLVFNMFAIEEYSHKEIAERLNISVNTSKSQLFKARKLLKEKIKELNKNA